MKTMTRLGHWIFPGLEKELHWCSSFFYWRITRDLNLGIVSVAGWLAGNFFQASLGISTLLSAWMAGSIIIHVVMIELPEKRSPLAFISGVLVFTLLLKLYLNLQGIDRGI